MGTGGSKELAGLSVWPKWQASRAARQLALKNKVENLRAMGVNLWALESDIHVTIQNSRKTSVMK